MMERIAESKLPVLLSTGMSPLSETDEAVARLRARDIPLAVMQCTSSYPCPPEKIGLNLLAFFRERYGCPVGLSDHSGTIYAGLAAAALGSEVLEVHVTLGREMFGTRCPRLIDRRRNYASW
jgi:N-acetylneuraminate synthase